MSDIINKIKSRNQGVNDIVKPYFYFIFEMQECPTHEKAGFDRLKPRHSTTEGKRKLSSSTSTDQIDEEGNSTKVRKTEFKREYSKLRKLVPALNARNDITKVRDHYKIALLDIIISDKI